MAACPICGTADAACGHKYTGNPLMWDPAEKGTKVEAATVVVKDAQGNTFQVNEKDAQAFVAAGGQKVNVVGEKQLEGYKADQFAEPGVRAQQGGQSSRPAPGGVVQQEGGTFQLEQETPVNFGRMTKPQLEAYATEHNVNIEGAETKAAIVAKLIEAQGDEDDEDDA